MSTRRTPRAGETTPLFPASKEERENATGVLLGLDELENLQRKILEWDIFQRRPAGTPHPGPCRSLFRGHGMELHDVRPYQAGDDIRHMDWRATARSGKPITKVFVEERSRTLYLLADRRPSMAFGTRCEPKAATAARAAAILAFSALAARERIAGIVMEKGPTIYPPVRTLAGALPLILATAAPLPRSGYPPHSTGHPGLGEVLEQIAKHAEPGASLCLISDLHDLSGEHSAILAHLSQRLEVLAIRIVDRAEEHLQDIGRMRIFSPQTGKITLIDTSDRDLRRRYAESATQHRAALQRICADSAIPLMTLYNDLDTFGQLASRL